MKSIELSDTAFEVLTRTAIRKGYASLVEYLEDRQEIHLHQKTEREKSVADRLQRMSYAHREFGERFLLCMAALHKVAARDFAQVEGLTRPNGRVIYVSKDRAKIERTAGPKVRIETIPNSEIFINLNGGQAEFELLVDQACHALLIGTTLSSTLRQIISARVSDEDLLSIIDEPNKST